MNRELTQMSAPEDKSLPRALRVRKRRNFLYLQRTGKRASGDFVVLIAKELSASQKKYRHGRIGLTVTKKVGNAVVRNKTKRRLRHVFRLCKEKFVHQDIIVLAKPEIVNAEFSAVQNDIDKTLVQLLKMPAKKRRRGAPKKGGR